VGREAVTAALHAFDFGNANGLLATIAESWKVAPEEVIRMANASEPRFPELAGPVVNAAEQGDDTARAIMERAGQALASLASAVIKRLWPSGGVVPVALAGGVLQGSALVRHAFREAMKAEQPQAAVSFAFVRPVLGALEIAAQRGVRR
jgi:N-acetylglucosamine kinase-like BadF-type ATPase